ncbi:MAG: transporter substrate-binding domain-containing protein [Spirochaetota bacterium]
MKFRIGAAVAVGAILVLLAACTEPADEAADGASRSAGNANELQQILERGVLRVGTTGDFFMSFIDPETGERGGYDIELTTQLAADMGVEIEYVSTDWPSLVSGLAAGRYDITTGASFNPGRARTASYTLPIARVGTVAVVRRTEASRFSSWDTINQPDVTVAVRQGSVFEDQASGITPDADIRAVAAPATEYQEVLAGRADVAITSLFDAASLVSDQESLQIAPVDPRNTNFIGILVPQEHHELRTFIDAWIRSKEYSGYIDELTERWNLAF